MENLRRSGAPSYQGFFFHRASRVRRRCSGHARKRITEKATPFTKDVVRKLETHVIQGGEKTSCILAGFVLFAIYARGRVGDLARIQKEPVIDASGALASYMEVEAEKGKTMRGRRRQRLGFPVVAPRSGMVGAWADTWLEVRRLRARCWSLWITAPTTYSRTCTYHWQRHEYFGHYQTTEVSHHRTGGR